MSPLLLLMRRDLRRRPGQTAALFVLALLAGLLTYAGLVLATDYPTNVHHKAVEWNAPEAMAVIGDGPATDAVVRALHADARVEQVETTPAQAAQVSLAYGGEELAAIGLVYDIDTEVTMGRHTITEETPAALDRPIYAPAVLLASGSYGLGDPITLDTLNGEVTFQIKGFVEDLYTGSPGFGILGFGLPHHDFTTFDETDFTGSELVKVAAASSESGSSALASAVTAASVDAGPAGAPQVLWTAGLDQVSASNNLSSQVFSVILVAFAALIVLVAAVMIRFMLRNAITTDLVSIGTLRATGFSTARIIAAITTPVAVCTLAASGVGIGLSYLTLPLIQRALRAQSGLSWTPGWSWTATAITLGGILAVVLATAMLSAVRLRRVSTIEALRGGTSTHSFRGDPLPLSSTRGPLPLLLGVKTALRQAQQSAVITVTVAIVTFAAAFSVGMTSSLLANPQQAVQMLAGEVEDVTLIAKPGTDLPALLDEVREVPGVDGAIASMVLPLTVDGSMVMFQVTDDPTDWRYNPVYTGRLPRHPNEIVLGATLADQAGAGVGDTYRTDVGAGAQDYLVTGIATGARNLGRFTMLTTAGFQRLDPSYTDRQIAIYVDGGTGPVISAVKARFGDRLSSVEDTRSNVQSQLAGYLAALPLTATIVLGFTGIVVALVVSLIVTTMLVQSRRELGIQKATGFTQRELTVQTMWTYLPPVAVGALLGAAVAAPATAPLLTTLLGSIGVLKVAPIDSPLHLLVIPLAVTALAWLVIAISARRIRQLSVQALISE